MWYFKQFKKMNVCVLMVLLSSSIGYGSLTPPVFSKNNQKYLPYITSLLPYYRSEEYEKLPYDIRYLIRDFDNPSLIRTKFQNYQKTGKNELAKYLYEAYYLAAKANYGFKKYAQKQAHSIEVRTQILLKKMESIYKDKKEFSAFKNKILSTDTKFLQKEWSLQAKSGNLASAKLFYERWIMLLPPDSSLHYKRQNYKWLFKRNYDQRLSVIKKLPKDTQEILQRKNKKLILHEFRRYQSFDEYDRAQAILWEYCELTDKKDCNRKKYEINRNRAAYDYRQEIKFLPENLQKVLITSNKKVLLREIDKYKKKNDVIALEVLKDRYCLAVDDTENFNSIGDLSKVESDCTKLIDYIAEWKVEQDYLKSIGKLPSKIQQVLLRKNKSELLAHLSKSNNAVGITAKAIKDRLCEIVPYRECFKLREDIYNEELQKFVFRKKR